MKNTFLTEVAKFAAIFFITFLLLAWCDPSFLIGIVALLIYGFARIVSELKKTRVLLLENMKKCKL